MAVKKLTVEGYALKQKEAKKRWHAEHPNYMKDRYVWLKGQDQPAFLRKRKDLHLRDRYGITIEQYEDMLQSQNGLCTICGVAMDSSQKTCIPHVDHDHSTGKVRGILCGSCNAGLGNFRDDVKRLLKAVDYLTLG